MRWTRNRYCVVCSAVFFIHFLLKKRKVFFSLFFVSCFSSLVCSVRLFVYSLFGVVLFALHVLLYYIREQTLFISSAFITRDFLLRSNRLIDCFFSTVASITFIQQWCCHFIGSWRRQFRLLVAILLRSWRLLCLTI